jgi:hypothetical protein
MQKSDDRHLNLVELLHEAEQFIAKCGPPYRTVEHWGYFRATHIVPSVNLDSVPCACGYRELLSGMVQGRCVAFQSITFIYRY